MKEATRNAEALDAAIMLLTADAENIGSEPWPDRKKLARKLFRAIKLMRAARDRYRNVK